MRSEVPHALRPCLLLPGDAGTAAIDISRGLEYNAHTLEGYQRVAAGEERESVEQEGKPREPEEEDRELLVRLRRLEGQIRGIQRMVANGRPCEEIVTQVLAVRAAVDRVGLLLLSRQVEACLQEGLGPEEMEDLKRALRHLTRLGGGPDDV